MMDVRANQRELMTDSNRTRDSSIRFYRGAREISISTAVAEIEINMNSHLA